MSASASCSNRKWRSCRWRTNRARPHASSSRLPKPTLTRATAIWQQEVALVPVENEPGAAARVFQQIAEAHINVRYSYLATGNRLVIASDKPQAVLDRSEER